MKLSFVIPAFNEESNITDCLKSVFKETRGRGGIEIIVVNNGSTDKTKDIALSFPGVKIVDEEKRGLTWARQAGSLAAAGELIANIDADTRLPEGWVDTVFVEFSKNKNLVALSGPHVFRDIPETSQILVRLFYYLGYLIYLINYRLLKRGAMLQGGNYIIKKSALEKIGGYSLDFDFYEDSDIARRIINVGDVKFTFKLPIYASGRRLKREGLLKVGARYSLNYFWVMFKKKPLSKEIINIRDN